MCLSLTCSLRMIHHRLINLFMGGRMVVPDRRIPEYTHIGYTQSHSYIYSCLTYSNRQPLYHSLTPSLHIVQERTFRSGMLCALFLINLITELNSAHTPQRDRIKSALKENHSRVETLVRLLTPIWDEIKIIRLTHTHV